MPGPANPVSTGSHRAAGSGQDMTERSLTGKSSHLGAVCLPVRTCGCVSAHPFGREYVTDVYDISIDTTNPPALLVAGIDTDNAAPSFAVLD